MSRWTQYLERYERRRNAFLLLTLSGAIRPAEVEAPCFRGRMADGLGRGATSALDPVPQAEQSIWSMDLRQLFSKKACGQGRCH